MLNRLCTPHTINAADNNTLQVYNRVHAGKYALFQDLRLWRRIVEGKVVVFVLQPTAIITF